MLLITIKVDFSAGELRLTEPDPVQLGSQDVEWQFLGIPNNFLPVIRFAVNESTDTPRGPFANLRQTTNQVFGLGRSRSRQGSYEASIVPATTAVGEVSAQALSAFFELEVGEADRHGTPIITVRPEGTDGLVVDPDPFSVSSGDPVIWLFEEIEEERWSPMIRFNQPAEGSGLWPFGPFTNLMVGEAMVVATGNTHVTGAYGYEVAIVDDRTGEVLRKGDPVVGNNGDPPGGS